MKLNNIKQIFISGASLTYGVGGAKGGWADMIKLRIHKLQYNPRHERDKKYYEVYNFAKPGMVIDGVLASITSDIKYRKHESSESIIILSVGMNNTKSTGTADNHFSTIE